MNMGISHIFPKSILRVKGPSLIDIISTRTRCVVWMSPAGLERKFDYIRNITHFLNQTLPETFLAPKVLFSGPTGSSIPGAARSC